MAIAQNDAPLGAVTILRVVNYFTDLLTAYQNHKEAKITRRELSRLSESQLRDIGLTRDYVESL